MNEDSEMKDARVEEDEPPKEKNTTAAAAAVDAPRPPPQDRPIMHNPEPECFIYIRGLVGPPITDSQRKELHDWTEEIFKKSLSSDPPSIKPSEALASLLGEFAPKKDLGWTAIICPLLMSCVTSLIDESNVNGDDQGTNGHSLVSMKAPLEFTFGKKSHPLPAASLYLYYFALEQILRSHRSNSRYMLLLNAQFHKSLFSLCHFCLNKATDHGKSLFNIKGTGSCPIVYYKLVEAYLQEMGTTSNKDMVLPTYLTQVLRLIQEMLLDSLWSFDYDTEHISSFGPSFIGMINKLRERPSCWPLSCLRELCPIKSGVKFTQNENSKESMFVGYIVQKLLVLIESRLQTICNEMSLSSDNDLSNTKAQDVKEKTMTLFASLMCYRIDMFFNRHPDQIMLCTLYIICTKMALAPKMTFVEILRAYKQEKKICLSPAVVRDILHRINNCSDDGGEGNIVEFYNNIFVPSMKGLWGAFLKSFNSSEATTESPTAMSDVMILGTPS